MKKILIVVFTVLSVQINAQIAGLSASKLIALNAGTVPAGFIEFEPAFTIGRNLRFMDIHQHAQPMQDTAYNSFSFRFTLGLTPKIETGIVLPTNVSQISYGLKYNLLDVNKFQGAVIFGTNFDFSLKQIVEHVGMGWVSSFQWSDRLSTDLDVQFIRDFNHKIFHNYTNLETGYYFFDNTFQFILGLNSGTTFDNSLQSLNIYLTPGFTYERGQNYIIVIGFPYSVRAMNDYQNFNFMFALTITLM